MPQQPALFPFFDDDERPRAPRIPSKGTLHPRPIIAIDFGTGAALAIHGPDGPMRKPRLPAGGKAEEFPALLEYCLEIADTVVEDPTMGSSGAEPQRVASIVAAAPHGLYTISARAVKNWRKDNGISRDPIADEDDEDDGSDHAKAAEIIYTLASTRAERLKHWKPLVGSRLERIHKSVRPWDKRDYRGEECDRWMRRFPPFSELPGGLRRLLGNGTKSGAGEYSRARAMPLAMALDEPEAGTRTGYERVLGLYDHGYPSFYRRNTIDLMQLNAKHLAGETRMSEVSAGVRKEAWRLTRRQIRQIYHLLTAAGTSGPAEGHVPSPG